MPKTITADINTKQRKPKWRCFSCGRVLKSRYALYAHLTYCYWFQNVFKHRIQDAPFYVERPSRQLRYYHRNKDKIKAKKAEKAARVTTTMRVKTTMHTPSTLRRR